MSRHGGPNDRGAADAWYLRPFDPHYYKYGSYSGPRIERADMTDTEIAEYRKGFDDGMESGDHKDYG